LTGTGNPANTLGVDGNFYLDTSGTHQVYEKVGGAWVNMTHTDSGTQWLHGAVDPTPTDGGPNTYWLNTATHDVWYRDTTTWVKQIGLSNSGSSGGGMANPLAPTTGVLPSSTINLNPAPLGATPASLRMYGSGFGFTTPGVTYKSYFTLKVRFLTKPGSPPSINGVVITNGMPGVSAPIVSAVLSGAFVYIFMDNNDRIFWSTAGVPFPTEPLPGAAYPWTGPSIGRRNGISPGADTVIEVLGYRESSSDTSVPFCTSMAYGTGVDWSPTISSVNGAYDGKPSGTFEDVFFDPSNVGHNGNPDFRWAGAVYVSDSKGSPIFAWAPPPGTY
jgi:hypothetical protein